MLISRRHVEGRPYLPGIDGLRALAVLSVMWLHLLPHALPGGFVGVDVFFVISGYVVTGSMLRESHRPFGAFISAFYARRFVRIMPALLICLGVTVLFSVALIPDAWLSDALRKTGLSAFFGLSNFALVSTNDGYFATRSEFNPFTHTWSLAVEEQFYLLFPLVLFASLRRTGLGLRPAGFGLIALLCAASIGWCIWASSNSPSLAYYMLPSRFWELGLGALLCLWGDTRRSTFVVKWGQARLMSAGLLLVAAAAVWADRAAFPFPWALPAVAGSLMLIAAASVPGNLGAVSRVLGSTPMVTIGLLSYSLYLWHWPVYTLMRWTSGLESITSCIAAVALTVACAGLSYRLVEAPSQRHPWTRRLSNHTTVLLGLGLIGVGWALSSVVYDKPWLFKQTVVAKNYVDWYATGRSPMLPAALPCELQLQPGIGGITVFRPIRCASNFTPLTARMFVIGDSHAGAYSRLLDGVVRTLGMEVHVQSKGGCPVADFFHSLATFDSACQQFHAQRTERLLGLLRPGDLVFLASLRIPRLSDHYGVLKPDVAQSEDQVLQAQADRLVAEQQAADLVAKITQTGARVILDLPKPVFLAPPFRCSDAFNRMNPVCAPGFAVEKLVMETHRRAAVEAIQRVAASNQGVTVWDPLPLLCPTNPCKAFDRNKPLFFDADHLSGHGNDVLLPSFLTLLRELIAQQRR